MKTNRSTLHIFLIALIFTSFYSCKKIDTQIDSHSVTQYSQLPADVSTAAQWYDQQVINRNSRNATDKNTIDWTKVIRSTMPDGSTVYALSISGDKTVMNELNINQSVNNQFYAVVKSYSTDSKTGITILKFLDLDENIIEQGVLKENGKYTSISKHQHIVGFSPPLKEQPIDIPSNGGGSGGGSGGDNIGGSGISIGVDGSGQTIVVITAPGVPSSPSDPGPVFSFPSIPSFPSDPGFPGGGSGGSGSSSNRSIIINNVKNPCLNALVNKIINQNFQDKMSSIVKDLSTSTKVLLTFEDAEFTSNLKPANTHDISSENNVIYETTTLSTDQLLGASKEYVTTVIIHEFIHGFFSSTAGGKSIDNSHEKMADSYVTPMVNFLIQLYPDMSAKNATALVWIGINDIPSFTKSDNFTYPGGTMAKQELLAIYANYVAKIYGTDLCN